MKPTKQRVLTELPDKEKKVALVMVGRAVRETFKGLDIVPPRFALVLEHDDIPWVASNITDNKELAEYLDVTSYSLTSGLQTIPVCIPGRVGPQASFLASLRANRGTQPMDNDALAAIVRTYMIGYLDSVVQFGGIKAATAILREHYYMADKDWVPGPEWHYWKTEPTGGPLPNGM